MQGKKVSLISLLIVVALVFGSITASAEENGIGVYAFELNDGNAIQMQSDEDDVAAFMRSISGSDQLSESGEGIRIAIFDLGMAEAHQLFAHNLSVSAQAQERGIVWEHATRIAGVVSAFAPDAKINSHWNRELRPMANDSADIAVHSWGDTLCNRTGEYSLESSIYDSYNIPVIFAVGNHGEDCGEESAYGTILMGGQSAKNVITVGSTDDNGITSPFSSKGPTLDGRIAPTVVLPGENVLTTCAEGTYCEVTGTSYTAPAVGGIVAQLFEQYRNMMNGTATPLAPATVRALLVNSAVDLGNPGPDYDYGFGQVNAAEASRQLNAYNIFENSVAHSQTSNSIAIVPESIGELRVTLAWNDLPAVYDTAIRGISGTVLVNDLNLLLTSPDGTVYQPFVLDPTNPSQAAGTGVDNMNTIEQIVVENPIPGEWFISVAAAFSDEAGDAQPFSLAYSVHEGESLGVAVPLAVPLAVSLSQVNTTTTTTNALLLTFVFITLATLPVAMLWGIKNG